MFRRFYWLALGAVVWFLGGSMVISSVRTVQARLNRPVTTIHVDLLRHMPLAPGDPVYLATEYGLKHVGEVSLLARGRATVEIDPITFSGLNRTVRAAYWRTPLSAEAAVHALLPRVIRNKAGCQLAHDWQSQEEELAAIWQPLVADLATAYVEVLTDEVAAAWRKHHDELRAIGQVHLEAFAEKWPTIQEHLRPILQEHLTPVLGQMITNAIAEAPKVEIAMLVARGKHGEAYERMLDWIVGYLAAISAEDRNRLNTAVRKTWDAASENPVLRETVESLSRPILEDARLRQTLAEIYREVVADNPRTAEFVRSKIVEDSRIRAQAYAFLEAFALTARTVFNLCSFDDQGATRPEIVHLVRSVALGRRVAWITLENRDASDAPLQAGAVLQAEAGDGPR